MRSASYQSAEESKPLASTFSAFCCWFKRSHQVEASGRRGRSQTELLPVNRFEQTVHRIRKEPQYNPHRSPDAPYGRYRGRIIIGECTPINGGVYLSLQPAEALVIDQRHGLLEKAYEEFMMHYVRTYGAQAKTQIERNVMETVVDFVKRRLLYLSDDQARSVIEQRQGQITADKKVALDVYLEHGIGTDRHQILLAAYLLEKLRAKGLINGRFYLDPNYNDPTSDKERLVYSSSTGYLFIFTPGTDD